MARPTKYNPEAMLPRIIEMGRIGCSKAEICADIDICFNTWTNWRETEPEFLRSTTRAEHLSQAWWESQGRQGIWSREFNAPAYSLQVRNRFPNDWRDKHDVQHSGELPVILVKRDE